MINIKESWDLSCPALVTEATPIALRIKLKRNNVPAVLYLALGNISQTYTKPAGSIICHQSILGCFGVFPLRTEQRMLSYLMAILHKIMEPPFSNYKITTFFYKFLILI